MFPIRGRTLLIAAAVVFGVVQVRADGSDDLPPEPVQIVFFVPSDLPVPDGAGRRLTQIADATEAFLFDGLARQGYPAATKTLFRREADGQVAWLPVRGDDTAASGKYDQADCADSIIRQAMRQSHVRKEGTVWWIFLYLGDRPARFDPWEGRGNPHDGGWAVVNYDSAPGEILPHASLTEGFNGEFALKSVIHELGHAFGLIHAGPDPTLGLGNSLMGPNPPSYARRRYPNGDRTYLSASEAAMLWKHPLFRGGPVGRFEPFDWRWDGNADFDPAADAVTVSGRLVSDQPAHSVVLIDDRGDPDEYWSRSYAARLAPDGAFQVKVAHPATGDGHYRLLFCFEDGAVIASPHPVPYRYGEGQFQFGK